MTEYNQKFPEGFIDYYLQMANKAVVYGVPANELTRDEAVACMISAFHDNVVLRAQHQKDLTVLGGGKVQ
jgi:hypothetical protein